MPNKTGKRPTFGTSKSECVRHPPQKRESDRFREEFRCRIVESHPQAEDAVRELQKDGFDMKKLSIVGKEFHTGERVVGY